MCVGGLRRYRARFRIGTCTFSSLLKPFEGRTLLLLRSPAASGRRDAFKHRLMYRPSVHWSVLECVSSHHLVVCISPNRESRRQLIDSVDRWVILHLPSSTSSFCESWKRVISTAPPTVDSGDRDFSHCEVDLHLSGSVNKLGRHKQGRLNNHIHIYTYLSCIFICTFICTF